jgi:hypothetical protein
MTFVPQSRLLPSTLWRPAIFFFAVAQIFLSFAPLIEGRQGPDAGAHVEAAGVTLHHAHNDADCAACTARHLLAGSEIANASAILVNGQLAQTFASSSRTVLLSDSHHHHSRAPPATA